MKPLGHTSMTLMMAILFATRDCSPAWPMRNRFQGQKQCALLPPAPARKRLSRSHSRLPPSRKICGRRLWLTWKLSA
jgi:hypothetical protein